MSRLMCNIQTLASQIQCTIVHVFRILIYRSTENIPLVYKYMLYFHFKR